MIELLEQSNIFYKYAHSGYANEFLIDALKSIKNHHMIDFIRNISKLRALSLTSNLSFSHKLKSILNDEKFLNVLRKAKEYHTLNENDARILIIYSKKLLSVYETGEIFE